jgi:cytochrome P450
MPKIVHTISNNMLSADEPDHTPYGVSSTKRFAGRPCLNEASHSGDRWRTGRRAVCGRESVRSRRPLFAKAALSVICDFLGLPLADRPKLRPGQAASPVSRAPLASSPSFRRSSPIKRYREERLEAARETGGEGLVAELVRVEEEGRRISRVYNCQRLHLRHSLARSTTSESRNTKCDVDQSARNRENWRCPLCEGNQAIAPVSSEFGGIVR